MSGKRISALISVIVLSLTALLLSSCSKTIEEARSTEPAPRIEHPVAPVSNLLPLSSPTPTPGPANKSTAPPTPAEIQVAVERVFGKFATRDAGDANFAVGDFNGDGSEDLAVVVKPSDGKLAEINSEVANWILEDPQKLNIPRAGPSPGNPAGKPVRADKGDKLLAIIHGFGPPGWRAPEAKQTYLLKNCVGPRLLAQRPDEVKSAGQRLPPLRGEILNETIGDKSGFLFWTGAQYAWWAAPAN